LSGTGLVPAAGAATDALVDGISAAEESIDTAIETAIGITKKTAVSSSKALFDKKMESFKVETAAKLLKSSSSAFDGMQKADSGSPYSWNETGSIILGAPDFEGGTIDYISVGSYTESETYETISSSIIKEIGKEAGESSDKLTFTGVIPSGSGIIIDGFMNDNFKSDFTFYSMYNTSTSSEEERSVKGWLAGSYRSGYAVSGNTVKCYVVISMELKATIDVLLNAAQLTGKTEDQIEDLIDSLFTVEGGATVKVYDEAGTLVHTQTFTAEEIWADDEE
jgi:hypothetical protein